MVLLHWKHNLSQGARAEFLSAVFAWRRGRACGASRALHRPSICTVDLIETGGALMVLEVNSGVMMESDVRQQATGMTGSTGFTALPWRTFPARRGA